MATQEKMREETYRLAVLCFLYVAFRELEKDAGNFRTGNRPLND